MPSPRLLAVALTLPAAFAFPAAATAQACGMAVGTGFEVVSGIARYDAGGGTNGYAVGGDGTLEAGRVSLRAGYRRIILDGATDPDVGRGALAMPLIDVPGVTGMTLCGTGHAGASRLSAPSGDAATALAGGVGLRLAGWLPPWLPTGVSYAEVRGLAARTAGTVLGADVDVTGLSLGVTAGVQIMAGPLTIRLAGAWDGFDDGLGPTPYPNQALELGLGYRF